MLASADGRIVVDGWPLSAAGRGEYEDVNASYEPEGWICGRVTMESFAGALRPDAEVAREHTGGAAREDFIAPGEHGSFAFAVDPSGRLSRESSDIRGDHVVAVLSARVSDGYLAFLRGRGVSYLLAGASEVDLLLAFEKIGARFGVRAHAAGGRRTDQRRDAARGADRRGEPPPLRRWWTGAPGRPRSSTETTPLRTGSCSKPWSGAPTTCSGCATSVGGAG